MGMTCFFRVALPWWNLERDWVDMVSLLVGKRHVPMYI